MVSLYLRPVVPLGRGQAFDCPFFRDGFEVFQVRPQLPSKHVRQFFIASLTSSLRKLDSRLASCTTNSGRRHISGSRNHARAFSQE